MSKRIVLDIETTGFSRQWDYIIELAAVCYDNDTGKELDRFHEYIKPNKNISSTISNLTGITNAMVANCRSEKDVLIDFAEWFIINNPATVVGHNCKTFDLQFLNEKGARYNTGWNIDGVEIADTLAMARALKKEGKIQVENLQQPTIAKFFNIEYEAHSAINDVEALNKIYLEMLKLNKPVSRADLGF